MKRTLSILLALALSITMFGIGAVATEPVEADVVLMALTRTASNAAFDQNRTFNADSGVFAASSNLTAWNNNTQIMIGYDGTERTPIVINNAAVTGNTTDGNGWRSVSSAAIDAGITVNTATAFQIRFETTGYENIRFSARQRSTGSGPQQFALAYSLNGPTGPFTPIANSTTGNVQSPSAFRDNAYTDFDFAAANTFTNFVLPATVADQAAVYLRVYLVNSTLEDRANGNTSINDIVVIGDEMPVEPSTSSNIWLTILAIVGVALLVFINVFAIFHFVRIVANV